MLGESPLARNIGTSFHGGTTPDKNIELKVVFLSWAQNRLFSAADITVNEKFIPSDIDIAKLNCREVHEKSNGACAESIYFLIINRIVYVPKRSD